MHIYHCCWSLPLDFYACYLLVVTTLLYSLSVFNLFFIPPVILYVLYNSNKPGKSNIFGWFASASPLGFQVFVRGRNESGHFPCFRQIINVRIFWLFHFKCFKTVFRPIKENYTTMQAVYIRLFSSVHGSADSACLSSIHLPETGLPAHRWPFTYFVGTCLKLFFWDCVTLLAAHCKPIF